MSPSDLDMPPQEIIYAADKVSTWFKMRGITDWELGDVCSRFSSAKSYAKSEALGMERATELLSNHFPLTKDNCEVIAEINKEIEELRK